MSDAEVETAKKCRSEHEIKIASIGLSGFGLSVFVILWALIILVRFYIFEGYWYTLFIFCMLISGIVFNITSINLLITDFTFCDYILPYVFGLPVTITWTITCIFMPLFKSNIFSQFSFMPIAVYERRFYEGLSYDPNNKTMHEYTRQFMKSNILFDNMSLVLIILCFAAIAQILFWIYTTTFYIKLRAKERVLMKQMKESTSKDL